MRAKLFGLLFLIFLLGQSHFVFAESSAWEKIHSLSDQGQFQEAIDAAWKTEPKDTLFYFNVGVLYYKSGDLGLARAYFEKAHQSTHHSEIVKNLEITRLALKKKLGWESIGPEKGFFESLSDSVPLGLILIFSQVGLILGLTLMGIQIFRSKHPKDLIQSKWAYLSSLFLIINVVIYAVQLNLELTPQGVFIQKATIRSGPGDQYVELAQMPTGIKVILMNEDPIQSAQSKETWLQIEFSGDRLGWVKSSSLLLL